LRNQLLNNKNNNNNNDIQHDLDTVRRAGPTIGLLLNENKCEIINNDNNVVSSIQAIMPNIMHIPCNDAVLHCAPIGDETAVETVLHSKLLIFQHLARRLTTPNALFLLKNCFRMPKLLYTLRCSRVTFQSEYDEVIKQTLQVILNTEFSVAGPRVWKRLPPHVTSASSENILKHFFKYFSTHYVVLVLQ